MSVVDRFIKYTKINTTTIPKAGVLPSNQREFELANLIAAELSDIGLIDVCVADNCILTATLPANTNTPVPRLLFSAHLDTSSEQTTDTYAQIHKNYNGGDIVLNANKNIVMSVSKFPELKNYIGEDIITTDGTSLLGADDKAGLAAIVSGLQYLADNPQIKHGEIKVAFLPDEEQGLLGAKAFSETNFADIGFMLDGGSVGEYCTENWNADDAEIIFNGVSAHPMSAKGKMVNSLLIAHEFISKFPAQERPEHTEGVEGYFWIKNLQGNTAKTILNIDIRDFGVESRNERLNFIKNLVVEFNKTYGENTVALTTNSRYSNVANHLAKFPWTEDIILEAMNNLNIQPKKLIMRGGYDGAVISQKGIPCPNIFTGAYNFHSIYEFLPVQSLNLATAMVSELATTLFNYAESNKIK
ncbi:MAG: peptidase T [Alphaproteobacteria bacterium]|jgi:tripeptide aminopeptidase|nr:peptidase T [Alphaproteobacteria bacterium]